MSSDTGATDAANTPQHDSSPALSPTQDFSDLAADASVPAEEPALPLAEPESEPVDSTAEPQPEAGESLAARDIRQDAAPAAPPEWVPWAERRSVGEPDPSPLAASLVDSSDLATEWDASDTSPDFVPPPAPYGPSYARTPSAQVVTGSMEAGSEAADATPLASRYPAGYASSVFPLPAARRRSRMPLVLGTLTAVVLVCVVVVGLTLNALRAADRSPTLYQSALTAQSNDWPNDKECFFKSDGYHIVGASNCYYSGAAYEDATISVTAKLLKGDPSGAYGIAFRRPSADNFYAFLITGNGDWFVLKGNTILLKPAHSSAITAGVGAINQLSVRMQGAHFTFVANGTQLGDLSDSTYATGAAGLAGDVNLDIAYTNFAVTRP